MNYKKVIAVTIRSKTSYITEKNLCFDIVSHDLFLTLTNKNIRLNIMTMEYINRYKSVTWRKTSLFDKNI